MKTDISQNHDIGLVGVPGHEISPWRMAVAGLCASLVGIGLARFAYTPLIPALIAAKWFAPSDVLYLGAANLAGYLLGALVARRAAARLSTTALLRGAMLLATAAFFACSVPLSLPWFFAWRLISGLSGGLIMVLAASTILPHTPAARRGIVGGVIFTGVGLGVAASGTLVPLLLRSGLAQTWSGLGALSGVLTVISWWNWPRGPAPDPVLPGASVHGHARGHSLSVSALIVEYGLNAAALVPHMMFLVDFVARGLNQGLDLGSQYWVLYGLGAMMGPLLTGHLADRIGFGSSLRLTYLVQATAIVIPAVTVNPAALIVSSVIVGACTPGVVPLVLGRVHELIPHSAVTRRVVWSRVTTSFALFQAASAYGLSFLFARTGGHYFMLFELGSLAAALALGLDLIVAVAARRAAPEKGKT